MLETAAFYKDYLTRGADGKIRIEPSVSPENSPGRFMPGDFQEHMGHPNPVVWNSTMDFAILRELFAHLLELSDGVEMDPRRVESWRAILKALPEYMVNSDGAIREWMDKELPDYYRHRHLSHLYPLFPGEEVRRGHPLFDACARAVDLRELGAASGWALASVPAIYARLGRGERALDCLNTLAKGCLLPNLFTLHNDWRDMGVSLRIDMAPVQLDALMGAANAIQEMLLDASPGRNWRCCQPARKSCTEEKFKLSAFPGGRVDMRWNREKRELQAVLKAERPIRPAAGFAAMAGVSGTGNRTARRRREDDLRQQPPRRRRDWRRPCRPLRQADSSIYLRYTFGIGFCCCHSDEKSISPADRLNSVWCCLKNLISPPGWMACRMIDFGKSQRRRIFELQ